MSKDFNDAGGNTLILEITLIPKEYGYVAKSQ
jgi:hypothetical protein